MSRLLLFAVVATSTSTLDAARPNVVWIVADDLSPDLSCYGTAAVETPNLDRLAREGTRYPHAFATSPVCSPSRSAFVTGTYQTSIGAHHHRTRVLPELPASVPTVMDRFRAAGYFVTNGDVNGKPAKTDYNFVRDGRSALDGSDWRRRAAGQPFFAQIQIREPHRPFRDNRDPDRPTRVEIPPIYPDHPITRADWANYLATVEEMDRKCGVVLRQLEDEGVADDTYVMFFGDHGRPHVWGKQWLYDGGIRVPLIVRQPGEHEKGEVDDRLVSLVDVAPASLTVCGIEVPKGWQGRDFLAATAAPRDAVFAARDRCGDARDRVRCVRTARYAYIRNFEPDRPYLQHSGYKKIQYPLVALLPVLAKRGELDAVQRRFLADRKPEEELYDLVRDPHQTRNLAGDAEHVAALRELRSRLDAWIETTGDRGREAEGDDAYFERLLVEKRAYYERAMRKRGLDPNLSDEEYVDWWTGTLLPTEDASSDER